MTLDLPTFERPRNATSGNTGAGNWLGSLTDIINRAKTRMHQFAVSCRKLQAERPQKRYWRMQIFPGRAFQHSAAATLRRSHPNPSGRLFSTSSGLTGLCLFQK